MASVFPATHVDSDLSDELKGAELAQSWNSGQNDADDLVKALSYIELRLFCPTFFASIFRLQWLIADA